MEGDHRKRSNEEMNENVERPSRGPQRRTRDSGAMTPTDYLRGGKGRREEEPADALSGDR